MTINRNSAAVVALQNLYKQGLVPLRLVGEVDPGWRVDVLSLERDVVSHETCRLVREKQQRRLLTMQHELSARVGFASRPQSRSNEPLCNDPSSLTEGDFGHE